MGSTMPFATRYEVSVQVLSSMPADRLPAIWGSETLTMVVSSTSMKEAMVTTRAISQGLARGRQAAWSWPIAGRTRSLILP
jgi:hypothetical protein